MGDLDSQGLHVTSPGTIRTYTGRRVDPLHLRVEDIDLLDIAQALSLQCRYNGHCEGFYSVARHSLLVATHLHLDDTLALWGLLHDAAEAYLGDLVRPLKQSDDMRLFREAEERAEAVIAEKFALPWPMPPEVKEADRFVLTEFELEGPRYRDTWYGSWETDRAEFIHRYYQLVNP